MQLMLDYIYERKKVTEVNMILFNAQIEFMARFQFQIKIKK